MMESDEADIFQRTRWALRHYAWLIALVMAAAVAVGWYIGLAGGEHGQYRATALVVANTLDVPPSQLPRFAAAVFDSGAVAEGVAEELGLALDPQELVPLRIAMDPVPDSIAFFVHGMSDDPQTAVDFANTAADQFVRELNRAGPGVGTFSVQDAARVPRQLVSGLPPEVALAVSGVGGMLIAVVLAGFIVWWRRPLLTASEVAAAFGSPFLGTVSVGRNGPLPGSARTVTSYPLVLHTLAQRLGSTPHDGFVLLGEPRSKRVRRALGYSLRDHLGRATERQSPRKGRGTVARHGRPGLSHRIRDLLAVFQLPLFHPARNGRTDARARSSGSRPGVPVVLMEDWAAQRTDASSWGVIVVVEQGTSTRRLSEILAEWPDDGLGVLMLRHQSRRTTRRARDQTDR